jgi:hypothetical protein
MPRTRPKTALDRPHYRPSPPPPQVPEGLEQYVDGLVFRQIVERYGVQNVQRALELIAEHQRREMIERRSQEIRDNWKENVRPLAAIRIPRLPAIPTALHREERLDSEIKQQARARQLEDGLAVLVERGGLDEWERRQLTAIVAATNAGETAEQIAAALGVSARTIWYRLESVRNADKIAVACEKRGSD